MNYQKIYESIIEEVSNEKREKENGIIYENHHVIPKCLGGKDENENLVLLTLREHFICHKLLTYIYPKNRKIALAYYIMVHGQQGKLLNLSSRDYEYAKEIRYRIKQKSHFEIWKEKYGIEEALKREKAKKKKLKRL